MLSPGEISVGMWVVSLGPIKKERDFTEVENPFAEILVFFNQEKTIPHIVLAVELPFIVVADCFTGTLPNGNIQVITKIWRMDEIQLKELTPEFVQAYDPNGYAGGEVQIKRVKMTKAAKLTTA